MGKKKTLRDHAEDLAESLAPAVESARDKAAPYVADARDKAAPLVSDARDRVTPLLDEAKGRVTPVLASARDIAAPYLSDARDVAAPYVADARDKVSDTFSTEVLPVLTAALAALDGATEDARDETAKRGRALASALRGEIDAPGEETSTHRLRNVLVALGLGAAGFAIVRRLNSRQQADSWQSSYTPPSPTPQPTTTPLADAAADSVADDAAASDPGEAAADATVTPHVPTTPDNPVTEVDVDKRQ